MKTSNVFGSGEEPEKKQKQKQEKEKPERQPSWEDMKIAIGQAQPDMKSFMTTIRTTVKESKEKQTITMAGSMTILTMKEILGLDVDTIWLGGDKTPFATETLFQRLWNIYIEIEGEDEILRKIFSEYA